MGPVMGDPVEDEHGNPDNCDTQQLTTTGLAYWRCSTNLVSFAAYPDGALHWALSTTAETGLVEWSGADADPPDGVTTIVAMQQPATVAADGPPLATQCLAAALARPMACASGDTLDGLATILTSGDTVSFDVNMPASGLHLAADLMDLPADYDLYVADGSGNIVAQSLEEGTTPEHVEIDLVGGTYALYVHSDPGRPADSQTPFRLRVRVYGVPVAQQSPG